MLPSAMWSVSTMASRWLGDSAHANCHGSKTRSPMLRAPTSGCQTLIRWNSDLHHAGSRFHVTPKYPLHVGDLATCRVCGTALRRSSILGISSGLIWPMYMLAATRQPSRPCDGELVYLPW